MPLDLEVFLAHTGASLFDYSPFLDNQFSFENRYKEESIIRNRSFPQNHVLIPNKSKKIALLNQKHFLSYEFDKNSKTCKKNCSGSTDDGKKKKVSFADDKGLSLVEIREIPETCTCPPNTLPPSDVKLITVQKRWKIAFEYPPWTDDKLIELLEVNRVVLESVKIKEECIHEKKAAYKCFNNKCDDSNEKNLVNFPHDVIEGNIKVKNLGYQKDVFIRITFDRWQSWEDIKATYSKPGHLLSEYDTFSFKVRIPPSAIKFEVTELCVLYCCNGGEYWDNNGGVNYRLVTEVMKNKDTSLKSNEKSKMSNDQITLSLTENIEKFSEIDSMNTFLQNQPYL